MSEQHRRSEQAIGRVTDWRLEKRNELRGELKRTTGGIAHHQIRAAIMMTYWPELGVLDRLEAQLAADGASEASETEAEEVSDAVRSVTLPSPLESSPDAAAEWDIDAQIAEAEAHVLYQATRIPRVWTVRRQA